MSIEKAIEWLEALPDKEKTNLKGKLYTPVAKRMEAFRKHTGAQYGIDTQISPFGSGVMCKCYIMAGEEVKGSGHAYVTNLQKEKSLEKLESVAIGRALASMGLIGGEYASDTEVGTWEERYEQAPKNRVPVEKTGNKAIDSDMMGEAIAEIQACEQAETARLAGREKWKELKEAGATEEQLGIIQDQTESRIRQLGG